MNKANVFNSQVHGDLKVGDENHYTINPPPVDPMAIARFLQRIEDLKSSDEEFVWFLERFNFLTNQKSQVPVIGLEQKLRNGGRDDLIEIAIERKDLFAKRLVRTQLARRRQAIFIYILQKINFLFEDMVRPLIKKALLVMLSMALYCME